MYDKENDSDFKTAEKDDIYKLLKEVHQKIDFIYICVVTAVGACAVWFTIKLWEYFFS